MDTAVFKNDKLNFIELLYLKNVTPCAKIHTHEELTITAIKKGSLNLLFNETSQELLPNEIAIINSDVPHWAELNTESKDCYVLYLKKDYLKTINLDFNSSFEVLKQKSIYQSFIKLCNCLLDKKVSLIEKEEMFISFCLAFFSFESTQTTTSCESVLALNIKKYLDENYLEELILEDLALKFDLSVVHLIRVFKKEFGLPIHSYILNKKIHLAKEQLSSNTPIIQIAQSCGFFDQSHLNRSFKRIFQITPKEYQKNIFSKC